MTKNSDNEAKVLLARKSREGWYKAILETLSSQSLTFDDLAKELGYPDRATPENQALSALVSELQEVQDGKPPKIKSACAEDYQFALYRADKESELVEKHILSEEGNLVNLKAVSHEFGFGNSPNTRFLSDLKSLYFHLKAKER